MKILTRLFLCLALLALPFAARAERIFNQAELEALLAPVALYPDAVLNDILVAASYPNDVREAAAWARAYPQLRGDESLRLTETQPWHPSVKALVAFPELIERMDESPQWLADLGEAYRVHGPYLMDSVQTLRARAQANGYAPEPVAPPYYPVRYYDPFVVYGAWWWPAYRPIVWRPFVPHVVVISRPFYVHRPALVQRPVIVQGPAVVRGPTVVQRPVVVQRPPITQAQLRAEPQPRRDNGGPSPAVREQQKYAREREQARAPQQATPRHDQGHDFRPRPSPQSEPKGKVAAAPDRGRHDNGQHNGQGNGQHRGGHRD